jgi:hypothetical protein
MLLKPDNKCEERVDIILLSEIIANFTYWQELNRFAEKVDPPTAFYPQINLCPLIQAILFCNTSR